MDIALTNEPDAISLRLVSKIDVEVQVEVLGFTSSKREPLTVPLYQE